MRIGRNKYLNIYKNTYVVDSMDADAMRDAINGLADGNTLIFKSDKGDMAITNNLKERGAFTLRYDRIVTWFDKVSTVGREDKSVCLWYNSRVTGMLTPSNWRL